MKRVAIIGAGASGLTAIKCCLDEGLEPVCFERSNYIGGLWHYTEEAEEGQGCVMKSTVINTSKEMMCYSDFPIPAEFPMFMHNKCVDQYLNMYSERFELKKYITFGIEVKSVKQASSFAETGKWVVETTEKASDKTNSEEFDGVFVCTGHHAEKNIPKFQGLENFKGQVTHTHDYKNYKGYEDKRVLIIGIGNSGGDVATELSRISSQVYLSTRSGTWMYNRVASSGDPVDMVTFTRLKSLAIEWIPSAADMFLQWNLSSRFDHRKYCLQPSNGPLGAHPTVNDELPNRIVSGGVIIKADIAEFTETGAKFVDGTTVEDIDCVVLATGYIFGFPFLDKSVVDVKDNRVDLYKYAFPPDLEKNTLAIIGCVQPFGAIMPISEMQCRLAARVFKGEQQLPNRAELWRDIRTKHDTMAKRYRKSQRHTIQVDYVTFMDELAELIGCKPDIVNMMKTDPKLAAKCFFGPCTPYQFRLNGPGSWPGARPAIMSQWKRTYQSLKTRPCEIKKQLSGVVYLLVGILLTVFFLFIL